MGTPTSDFPTFVLLPISRFLPSAKTYEQGHEGLICRIAGCLRDCWAMAPIVIDDSNALVSGHRRIVAASQFGIQRVPAVKESDLSPSQLCAHAEFDVQLAEWGFWPESVAKISWDEFFNSEIAA